MDIKDMTPEQKTEAMEYITDGMTKEEAIAKVTGEEFTAEVAEFDARPCPVEECDKVEHIEKELTQKLSHAPAIVDNSRAVSVQHEYSTEEIETIKDTVAKGASDSELKMFLHICKTYGLDPFLKEIYYSAQMKTMITSRDGYLKAAQRDPLFDGIQSMAVCENDDFGIDAVNNTVTHTFAKGDRGQVIGAWAMVFKKGFRPVIAYADYKEYNKGNSIWKTYKSAMCCKVAEVFALKRQFGISGLVTQEEMGDVQ